MHVQLQPAYLLHRRAFRDNAEILELFTAEHGRVSLMARGLSRRRRGGSLAALLQPFQPLLVSFRGRGDLPSLAGIEGAGSLSPLAGDALLSGFYLNELLLRLLERFQAQTPLFAIYGQTLGRLADGQSGRLLEATLRAFEFQLLAQLGYGVDMQHEAGTGEPLSPGGAYRLVPEQGFYATDALSMGVGEAESDVYGGETLLALAAQRFDEGSAPTAKRLARTLLQPHLGPQPLRSREMFSARLNRGKGGDGA